MILRHKREPKQKINLRLMELQIAKEILSEIFHARPTEVEEMIQSRLAERGYTADQTPSPDDGLWPATFCLGE